MSDGNGGKNYASGYEAGGVAFVGCILAGIGIGIWLDEFWAATILGIGAGFILMGLLRAVSR